MFQNKRIIAFIPLRGGSKSIPYKNIKEMAGKPLAYWVCSAAKNSKYIDEVYVSTEDAKIKEAVSSFNLGIKIADRPVELAADTTSTIAVVMDFINKIKDFDLFMLMQATSPLTTNDDIDRAIEQFFKGDYDSLVSGVVTHRYFWTRDGKPLNYDPMKRQRRQDWAGTVMENGAIYISKKEILEKYRHRLAGKICVFEMSEENAVEIDEPADWLAVEKLLLEHKK